MFDTSLDNDPVRETAAAFLPSIGFPPFAALLMVAESSIFDGFLLFAKVRAIPRGWHHTALYAEGLVRFLPLSCRHPRSRR